MSFGDETYVDVDYDPMKMMLGLEQGHFEASRRDDGAAISRTVGKRWMEGRSVASSYVDCRKGCKEHAAMS